MTFGYFMAVSPTYCFIPSKSEGSFFSKLHRETQFANPIGATDRHTHCPNWPNDWSNTLSAWSTSSLFTLSDGATRKTLP